MSEDLNLSDPYWYRLARWLLFRMDPERAHGLALSALDAMSAVVSSKPVSDPVHLWGLTFPNRVGLAAGLDKDARHVRALSRLGFGFVEVGTVTPRPQPGNPRPRLFRLPEHRAIINRMGFNNDGIEALVRRLEAVERKVPLGINIGKNKATPNSEALGDYLKGLRLAHPVADYLTVNISSPNTPDLRNLQYGSELADLLGPLKDEQERLNADAGRRVPILVKVAPDLEEENLVTIAETLRSLAVDGLIATNTTISRQGIESSALASEAGGLSGAPLTGKSTQVIRHFRALLGDNMPIIGVGGIMSGRDAAEKIEAGANLVQIYTGFIYRGPHLIKEAALACRAAAQRP
jgi:dihydroorotate dehydrogenase